MLGDRHSIGPQTCFLSSVSDASFGFLLDASLQHCQSQSFPLVAHWTRSPSPPLRTGYQPRQSLTQALSWTAQSAPGDPTTPNVPQQDLYLSFLGLHGWVT